jgi:hypothetical protein
VYRIAGVTVPDAVVAGIAGGPVFASDAKTGADFAAKSARDEAATRSAVTEDEIAKVAEWIGLIAQQAGVSVPLRGVL